MDYIKLIENSPIIPTYLISQFYNRYHEYVYDENVLNVKKK